MDIRKKCWMAMARSFSNIADHTTFNKVYSDEKAKEDFLRWQLEHRMILNSSISAFEQITPSINANEHLNSFLDMLRLKLSLSNLSSSDEVLHHISKSGCEELKAATVIALIWMILEMFYEQSIVLTSYYDTTSLRYLSEALSSLPLPFEYSPAIHDSFNETGCFLEEVTTRILGEPDIPPYLMNSATKN